MVKDAKVAKVALEKGSADKPSSPEGPGLVGSTHSYAEGFSSFSLSSVPKLTASYTQEKVPGQSSSVWTAFHYLSPSKCLSSTLQPR